MRLSTIMHYQCQGLARVLSNDCILSTNQSFYRYASEDSIEALSFCLVFLFQAFADLRHRQGMLRKNSTVRKIKVMKVIRIIGIHNRDNEFPNKVIVSIYESCITW